MVTEIAEIITGEEAGRRYRELRQNKIPLPRISDLFSDEATDAWSAGKRWQIYPHPCVCENGTNGTACPRESVHILHMRVAVKEEAGRLYVSRILWYHAPRLVLILTLTVSRLYPPRYDFRVEELDIVERTFGRDSLISRSNGCSPD